MTRPVQGLPGGAQEDSVTTSPVAVDLSAFRGRTVLIWSDDVSLWLGWAATATSPTLVTSGDSAASLTSAKADRVRQGRKLPRLVDNRFPFLIVAAVSGSGTVHVKLVSDADGADLSDEESSGAAVSASISGTVTTAEAAPTVTDNTTYLVDGDMSASITNGTTIALGPKGRLEVYAAWTTGTPIGRLKLMGRAPDGTTFFEIPNQAGGWHTQPAGTTGSTGGLFRELAPISHVRIDYERTSSGSAAALDIQTRVS